MKTYFEVLRLLTHQFMFPNVSGFLNVCSSYPFLSLNSCVMCSFLFTVVFSVMYLAIAYLIEVLHGNEAVIMGSLHKVNAYSRSCVCPSASYG